MVKYGKPKLTKERMEEIQRNRAVWSEEPNPMTGKKVKFAPPVNNVQPTTPNTLAGTNASGRRVRAGAYQRANTLITHNPPIVKEKPVPVAPKMENVFVYKDGKLYIDEKKADPRRKKINIAIKPPKSIKEPIKTRDVWDADGNKMDEMVISGDALKRRNIDYDRNSEVKQSDLYASPKKEERCQRMNRRQRKPAVRKVAVRKPAVRKVAVRKPAVRKNTRHKTTRKLAWGRI